MTYGTLKLLSSADRSNSVKLDAVPLPGASSNRCHPSPWSWLIALGICRGSSGSDGASAGSNRATPGSPTASSGSSRSLTLKRNQMTEYYVIHSSTASATKQLTEERCARNDEGVDERGNAGSERTDGDGPGGLKQSGRRHTSMGEHDRRCASRGGDQQVQVIASIYYIKICLFN